MKPHAQRRPGLGHLAASSLALSSLVLSSLVLCAPAHADEEAPLPHSEIKAIDFASLPQGSIPPLPAVEVDGKPKPLGAPVTGIKLHPADEQGRPIKSRKLHRVKRKSKEGQAAMNMTLEVASPKQETLYRVTEGTFEFASDGITMSCDGEGTEQLRWESFTVGADGNGRLEIKDMRFDHEKCQAFLDGSAVVSLKPIAWYEGQAWLYGMQDERSVTVVMPRSDTIVSDSMIGTPTTVRGAATRATLPRGRWGAGSVEAQIAAMSMSPPGDAPDGSEAHEVAIELVQTLSESVPTLLVRRTSSVPSAVTARDML